MWMSDWVLERPNQNTGNQMGSHGLLKSGFHLRQPISKSQKPRPVEGQSVGSAVSLAVKCSVSPPYPVQTLWKGSDPQLDGSMLPYGPEQPIWKYRWCDLWYLDFKEHRDPFNHPQMMIICCKNTPFSKRDGMLGKPRKSQAVGRSDLEGHLWSMAALGLGHILSPQQSECVGLTRAFLSSWGSGALPSPLLWHSPPTTSSTHHSFPLPGVLSPCSCKFFPTLPHSWSIMFPLNSCPLSASFSPHDQTPDFDLYFPAQVPSIYRNGGD